MQKTNFRSNPFANVKSVQRQKRIFDQAHLQTSKAYNAKNKFSIEPIHKHQKRTTPKTRF
jgi:hypothetical protein